MYFTYILKDRYIKKTQITATTIMSRIGHIHNLIAGLKP